VKFLDPLNIADGEKNVSSQSGVQGFLSGCIKWLPREGWVFAVGVLSGFCSGLMVWWIDDYSTKSNTSAAEERIIDEVRLSTKNECQRVKARFDLFYSGYPTRSCKINVYRLLPPDKALVSYLGERREIIAQKMGQQGLDLVRDSKLSSDAYERIFTDKFFDAMQWKDSAKFSAYFRPLQSMCEATGIKIEIAPCPW
jgi:hypothetical protein